MLKKIVIFMVILVMAMAALPAIDGFLFKRYFQRYLSDITQKIPAKSDVSIELAAYQMGWMQSTGKLIVSIKEDAASAKNSFSLLPKKYEIDMVISHGPIVSVNGKWKIAYANVAYQMKIPYFENTPLTANTWFGLFTNKSTTNYSLGTITLPKLFSWDGFHGEIVTSFNGKDKIISTFNLGKLDGDDASGMNIHVSPMQFYHEIVFDLAKRTMVGKSNTWSDGFTIATSPDMSVSAKKILFDSADSVTNDVYQYQSSLHIDQLILPLTQQIEFKNLIIENKLSNFNLALTSIANHDFSYAALFEESTSPASRMESKTGFDTSHGHTDFSAVVSDLHFPTQKNGSADTIKPDKYNVVINAVMPQELAVILLTDYLGFENKMAGVMLMFASNGTPSSMPTADPGADQAKAKSILAQLVTIGFLIEKDSNYTLSLSMTPEKSILNGTDTSSEELQTSLDKIFGFGTTSKACVSYMTNVYGQMVCSEYASTPAAAASPPPATAIPEAPVPATATPETKPAVITTPPPESKPAAQPATAVPVASNGCYWQQTTGGKTSWILIKELQTKEACFKMDSCSGGQSKIKGNCFKWATSADADAQAW